MSDDKQKNMVIIGATAVAVLATGILYHTGIIYHAYHSIYPRDAFILGIIFLFQHTFYFTILYYVKLHIIQRVVTCIY